MTDGLQGLIVDEERLQRVTAADLMGHTVWGRPVWIDHVLLDIPETLAGAVRDAASTVQAVTIHENVVILHLKYAELFRICKERGIVIVIALAGSFERVLLATYKGDKPC